jgi:hypothetical protein
MFGRGNAGAGGYPLTIRRVLLLKGARGREDGGLYDGEAIQAATKCSELRHDG